MCMYMPTYIQMCMCICVQVYVYALLCVGIYVYIYIYVCIYVYVYIWVRVHMFVCVDVHVFNLWYCSPYLLRSALSLAWNLTVSPRDACPSTSQHWGYKSTPPCRAFFHDLWGSEFRSPCVCRSILLTKLSPQLPAFTVDFLKEAGSCWVLLMGCQAGVGPLI